MDMTKWNEAMDWWRNAGMYSNIFFGGEIDLSQKIRQVAIKRLRASMDSMGCEEQGISSSDVNYEVFQMYQEFKRSGSESTIVFLVDANAEVA